jgi:hypothetical protein
MPNELERLQEWFASHCDGDWEHGNGVRLTTLDNPGWALDIQLDGTELENAPFQTVRRERSESDWVHCSIEGHVFCARGGTANLSELVRTFLDWAKKEAHRGA